jgi:N-acetylglucosaminyldiphosphoundecaprenol N-acetyl-beta-D-mannosaminyltransferase
MGHAVALVDAAIAARSPLHLGVINAAKVVGMAKDPELRAAVLSSDAIFADGMSIVWASRLLGRPLPERVTGIDLMMSLLARGSERGYRVFCLGAREDVSKRTAEIIGRDFPGVQLVGRHHGYYSNDEEPRIVELIAAAQPDILFVAMTSPRKENFLARWGSALNTPVTHGVGGSFDVLAGVVKRAPPLWREHGLEWLYRLKQEPLRLSKRYLTTNTVFCYMVLKALGRRASV